MSGGKITDFSGCCSRFSCRYDCAGRILHRVSVNPPSVFSKTKNCARMCTRTHTNTYAYKGLCVYKPNGKPFPWPVRKQSGECVGPVDPTPYVWGGPAWMGSVGTPALWRGPRGMRGSYGGLTPPRDAERTLHFIGAGSWKMLCCFFLARY